MNVKKSALEAMLSQYEKSVTSEESTFDLRNYFTTYLKDGVNNKMMKIRILPTDGSPFEEVHVHSMKVDGKNRKFICPKHTKDEPCAFCDARSLLLASGDKENENLAKTYRARLMYIVKVIDRENESEGPKFWRFPKNFKKEGILDKIMATVRMLQTDITDVETGRDLVLNVERVKNPRGGTYPTVNSIQALDPTPLSTDERQKAEWLGNTKKWDSVYSIKNYDYLEIVVKGGIPAWSKKLEKFVDKKSLDQENTNENTTSDLESELSIGKKTEEREESLETTNSYVAESDTSVSEDDDLPF